jgi:hypothetical protein
MVQLHVAIVLGSSLLGTIWCIRLSVILAGECMVKRCVERSSPVSLNGVLDMMTRRQFVWVRVITIVHEKMRQLPQNPWCEPPNIINEDQCDKSSDFGSARGHITVNHLIRFFGLPTSKWWRADMILPAHDLISFCCHEPENGYNRAWNASRHSWFQRR